MSRSHSRKITRKGRMPGEQPRYNLGATARQFAKGRELVDGFMDELDGAMTSRLRYPDDTLLPRHRTEPPPLPGVKLGNLDGGPEMGVRDIKAGDFIADPDKLGEPSAYTDENGNLHINRVRVTNPKVIQRLKAVEDAGGDVSAEVRRLLRAGAAEMERLMDLGEKPAINAHAGETDEAAFSRFVLNAYDGVVDPDEPDLLTRVAMGSDPLTPEQRWAATANDAMIEGARAQLRGQIPMRPGSEDRVKAQADPSKWKRAVDNVCPRCGEDVPEPGHKGEYRGALSRTDNNTEICSPCGTDEAYEQAAGALRPQSDWPVPPSTPRPSRVTPPGQLAGYRETWGEMRGGHRPPRQPVPTPKELPDLRLHLMEKWLPDGVFCRALSNSEPMGPSLHGPGVSPAQRDMAAVLDSEFQRRMLAEASLWWVRDEMVDLVMAATKTTPTDLTATEVVLPAGQSNGMIMLAKPYLGTDAFNADHTVQVDIMCWGLARAKMGTIPCISMCMYRYFDFDGGLGRQALEDAITTGAIYDGHIQRLVKAASRGELTARLTGGSWVYVGRTDWPLMDRLDGFDAFEDEAGLLTDRQRASMVEDRRFFASFCLLVNHKLTQVDVEQAPRQTVRRAERELKKDQDAAREISTVKVVRLREIKRQAGETDEEHEKRKVEWTHRWISSGHWGWRWCGPKKPGQRYRRRTFVSPSIKGPKDLPLIVKETIRVWSR